MNKLFKDIRQGNIESVKAIIEKKPESVNEIFTGTKPKKDIGQSPLEVAIKCGAFEIVDYLLDHGADPNFVESQDHIDANCVCTSVLQIALENAMYSLLFRSPDHVDMSDKYVKVIERLLEMGADPNKNPASDNPARQPKSTMRVFVFSASNALKITNERAERHPERHEKVKRIVRYVVELLIKYKADFDGWFDNEESAGLNNRVFLLEDPPEEMSDYLRYEYRATQDMREILQDYFAS